MQTLRGLRRNCFSLTISPFFMMYPVDSLNEVSWHFVTQHEQTSIEWKGKNSFSTGGSKRRKRRGGWNWASATREGTKERRLHRKTQMQVQSSLLSTLSTLSLPPQSIKTIRGRIEAGCFFSLFTPSTLFSTSTLGLYALRESRSQDRDHPGKHHHLKP